MSTRLSRHALRIALITTAVVAGLVVALCVAIDVIVADTLRSSATTRLTTELAQLAAKPGGPSLEEPDVDDPVLVWSITHAGVVAASTPGAPALPASVYNARSPSETRIAGADVLVAGVGFSGGRLVGAVSLGNESKTLTALTITEAIVGPVLLILVFAGAFVVGRQTAGPIERARRRQLEFTADASHELRTPLAVIEAETTLALANLENDGADHATLRRVADETRRMRSIVEDLLWLARFDALPPDPVTEPVDLTTAADVGLQRFVSIAEHARLHLENRSDGAALALVDAPADWIDRLIGVLLDNACRYTPADGTVSIATARERDHVRLTVSDTGPGIPMERRARIFERFRRGTSEGDGAGLGLAIGNAIVEATRGRWHIADVPGGGTSVGVVWPHSRTRLVNGLHP
jgi:signal transduction histidine kinase